MVLSVLFLNIIYGVIFFLFVIECLSFFKVLYNLFFIFNDFVIIIFLNFIFILFFKIFIDILFNFIVGKLFLFLLFRVLIKFKKLWEINVFIKFFKFLLE